MSPKTVGIIAHTGKAGAAELVAQLCGEFEQAGVGVLLEAATAALNGDASEKTVAQLAADHHCERRMSP